MTQTTLVELARNGDPGAITTLINRSFQTYGITVSADWQQGQLNLRLIAETLPRQQQLMALVLQQMQALQVSAINAVKVYGYQTGDRVPRWHEWLDLTAAAPDLLAAHNGQSHPVPTVASLPVAPLHLPANPCVDHFVDHFLVCGLGDLGQYCVLNLKRFALREFEIHVTAIDKVNPTEWEIHDLPSLLVQEPIIGDCCNDEVLLRADIQRYRAILIVTSNDGVNIETAIAARRLNPTARLVVRSSRQSLNDLLKQQLGNFVAFDPTELPAAAFALEGLRESILGSFNIGDCRLQVVEQPVQPKDFRFDGILASTMHKKTYRLLSYRPATITSLPDRAFHQWQPDTKVKADDVIAYVEVVGKTKHAADLPAEETLWQILWQMLNVILKRDLRKNVAQFWRWVNAQRIRQVIGAGVLFAVALWLLGTGLLRATVPGMSLGLAASVAAILLLGGYGDVFGGLGPPALPVPPWVQGVCLLITIASIGSVLGVLGLITDSLLSSRFDFFRKRPAIPKQNHVVLVGLGRVGQRIAALLCEFRQPSVAIAEQVENVPGKAVVQLPMLIGNPVADLGKVNLATAKSMIVVTDDQMLNLEVALMARDANPDIGLVVRTYDQRFSDHLSNLLPDAKALTAYGLSAEAFAGAAFGENILGLFRLNNQTILVTEYAITEDDTLVGKILSQVAYGYSVIPIFHQRANQKGDVSEFIMPADDRRLMVGDRLVLLSSINGLRRIEHREIAPPQRWRLQAQKPLNHDMHFSSRNLLMQISGCSIEEATAFIDHLPQPMELWLYDAQADRLLEELGRQLPNLTLTPLN